MSFFSSFPRVLCGVWGGFETQLALNQELFSIRVEMLDVGSIA